jgi:hypothetical protein
MVATVAAKMMAMVASACMTASAGVLARARTVDEG